MGRKKRMWSPQHFYHVVVRGNRRDALFRDNLDFQTFFYILSETYIQTPFDIASYCIMTNHYHLQMRSRAQSLSKVMSLVNKRYANYYNTRYQLTGHVYEKRFYSKMIDSTTGLLEVSRYIHLNPTEAHMVRQPEDYPWSSYHYYIKDQAQKPIYLNTKPILDLYPGTLKEKRKSYSEFVRTHGDGPDVSISIKDNIWIDS